MARRVCTLPMAVLVIGVGALGVACGDDATSGSATSTTTVPSTTSAATTTVASTTAVPATTAPADDGRTAVIVDYSPTISDAGALLYIASLPTVDLLAVTLAGTGEADCDVGTTITHQLLAVAGRPDVPVGCGRETPLVGSRDWPIGFRDAANSLGNLLPPLTSPAPPAIDGETLLAQALSTAPSSVTLLTLGPLTNPGAVLSAQPSLAEHLERIVVMGGAVDVPGNVAGAPTAEWNLYVDPESVRLTLASGVPVTFVALDATNQVPWTSRLVARLATLTSAVATTEHRIVSENRSTLDGIYLWDELAAMIAVHPELGTVAERTIVIDDDGATVADPGGVAVDVVTTVDADVVISEFLTVLNGGTLPDIAPLTPQELAYVNAVAGFAAAFQAIQDAPPADGTELTPDLLVERYLEGASELDAAMATVEPPTSFATEHAALVDGFDAFLAGRDDLLAAVGTVESPDPFEGAWEALTIAGLTDELEAIGVACAALTARSLLGGGPEVCPSGS